jgi:hypothetical protein
LGFRARHCGPPWCFPPEAALLEAFLITYDELGLDEHDTLNPFFVEWVTGPSGPHEPEAAQRVHHRLGARSQQWTTHHRCWDPSAMPLMSEEPWPPELVAGLLGLN